MNHSEPCLKSRPDWARRGVSVVVLPILLALSSWLSGCGYEPGRAPSTGSYGDLAAATRSAIQAPPATPPVLTTNALLSGIQSELSPATLWHSQSETISLFVDLASTGLGGPTFLAYASPTGISVTLPGREVDGTQLRENWLLTGFAEAPGWTHWDSPWAVFLQRRPSRIRFDANGVHLHFPAAAGHFSLMPLYGYYKPPQRDQSFLKPLGFEEKELLTWEWRTVVARDPLTRLRYWAGATRRFPVHCDDQILVDRSRDTVTLRQAFTWIEVPDAWGTRPIRLAPVSPTLGLALIKGQSFPVRFSKAPADFGIATPYGPYFAVPEVDAYDLRFPVLRYLNETESPVRLPDEAMPEPVRSALDRLRTVARAKFPSPDRYQHDHGGLGNFVWAILGDQWYAKALPYFDPTTRSNAVGSLRGYFRNEVLVAERFREREFPAGSGQRYWILEGPGIGSWGVLGDAGKFSANLLQTLWAYAHFTGDHALIRERWPLIRRLFTTPAQIRWVGFGRDEIAELGDEAAPALAYARLAYLAGDLDAYHYGCAVFARELVVLYVKQRGARWFREQQPWHSMEPIDEEVYLTNLWGDLAGWQMDGPTYPREAGERQFANRWVRFQDLDVARFYRDHLRPEVDRELKALGTLWPPARRHTDDSHLLPSLVRLHSFLLNASPANLVHLASPDRFAGPPSGIIASCLAVLRTAGPPRYERLIPGAPPTGPVPGLSREVPGPHPHLVQKITFPASATNRLAWPRISWWGWKTPTGHPWNFGEVRAGTNPLPDAPAVVRPLSWNSVEIVVP